MTCCPHCGGVLPSVSTPRMGLTTKQAELLAFIRAREAAKLLAPSFQQMADHLQVASKSGVSRLIHALEERGHIRRLPARARAIEIVGQGA